MFRSAPAVAVLAVFGVAAAQGRSEPTAGELYENLQLLGGLPERELRPVMERWSAALGTGCSHCHESWSDAADTPMKRRAREMLVMVRTINASTFAAPGQARVTCWTCHQGRTVPREPPPLPTASGR